MFGVTSSWTSLHVPLVDRLRFSAWRDGCWLHHRRRSTFAAGSCQQRVGRRCFGIWRQQRQRDFVRRQLNLVAAKDRHRTDNGERHRGTGRLRRCRMSVWRSPRDHPLAGHVSNTSGYRSRDRWQSSVISRLHGDVHASTVQQCLSGGAGHRWHCLPHRAAVQLDDCHRRSGESLVVSPFCEKKTVPSTDARPTAKRWAKFTWSRCSKQVLGCRRVMSRILISLAFITGFFWSWYINVLDTERLGWAVWSRHWRRNIKQNHRIAFRDWNADFEFNQNMTNGMPCMQGDHRDIYTFISTSTGDHTAKWLQRSGRRELYTITSVRPIH